MIRRLRLAIGTLVVAAIGLALGFTGVATAQRPADGQAPKFQVDPWWPKPLPNNWLIGQAAGVAVDRHDHIWVIQRPRTLTEDERGATLSPPRSLCCVPAPPVLEFDVDGALLSSWGGPGAGYAAPRQAREHERGPGDERAVHRGRLQEPPRDRLRRADRRLQAALGRERPASR